MKKSIAAEVPTDEGPRAARPISQKAVVLVADDDPNDRDLLRYAVGAACPSLQMEFVHDGTEAVEHLCNEACETPDLIVLDLRMPRMNGLEVLDWMQSSFAGKASVILLTGSENPDHAEAAVNCNALLRRKPRSLADWIDFARELSCQVEKRTSLANARGNGI
jgi:CheY-like chemotaxis protein